jgi:hypothetical protein
MISSTRILVHSPRRVQPFGYAGACFSVDDFIKQVACHGMAADLPAKLMSQFRHYNAEN